MGIDVFSSAISLENLDLFPQLVELELSDNPMPGVLKFFALRVPNLRILKLEILPIMPSAFPLPLSQLTFLKINIDKEDMEENLLIQLTSLSSLDIRDIANSVQAAYSADERELVR